MILYVLMILVMRGMGKGQLEQFQPYELVIAILLADIFATPMESVSTPLLYGIVPVAALFVVHSLITLLCLRFDRIRAIISGKPTVVINDGRIMAENLRLAGRDENWLRQQLQKRRNKHARDVFLLSVDENGTVVCQLKEDVR